MASYTMSSCILEHLDEGREYSSVLLNTFTRENEHKLAIDMDNEIKKIYSETASKIEDKNVRYGVIHWLYLMSEFKPQKWDPIKVEDYDDVFLEVCISTVDKKMIVSSENSCKWKHQINTGRICSYKNKEIQFLNRDEAIQELKPRTNLLQQNNTNINTNTNN